MIRSFYPLLLISRDENFKQLMKFPISSSLFAVYNAAHLALCGQGRLVSVRNTWMGYGLLLSLLAAFTLCGYFLFHRIEVPFRLSVVPTLILVPISM